MRPKWSLHPPRAQWLRGVEHSPRPPTLVCAAQRCTCELLSGADLINLLKVALTTWVSQLFCHMEAVPGGGTSSCPTFHVSGHYFEGGHGQPSRLSRGLGWLWKRNPQPRPKRQMGQDWIMLCIPRPPWTNWEGCLSPSHIVVQEVDVHNGSKQRPQQKVICTVVL